MKFISKSEKETIELAEKLAKNFIGGEFIVLSGELGSGKTRFAKGLARGLEVADEVVSPTFTIKRTYEGRLTLQHFDFYRLIAEDREIQEELVEITCDQKNVVVIEWLEKQKNILSNEYLLIEIRNLDDEKREIDFQAKGIKYMKLLEKL